MSAIAPITLSRNGVDAVNFLPQRINADGVAKYADTTSGSPLAFPVVTHSLREPSKASRNYRVTQKIVVPVTEPVFGSATLAKQFDMLATVEFVLPERSSISQRQELLALAKSLIIADLTSSAVVNLSQVY